MWRKYFGEKAVIYGVDIDSRCKQFDKQYDEDRIGSQADASFLTNVVTEMGGLDLVIDDGSHISNHINSSFLALFELISDNGIYLCEDLHCAYWPGHYECGYRRKTTFIEKAKRMVDDIHSDFHKRGSIDISDANRKIRCIIYNSMVVI